MACLNSIFNPVGNIGEPLYPVSSGYGWRTHPITGERTFHFGIDIPAPLGTNVRSVLPGTVIQNRLSDTAGRVVKIKHTDGSTSTYMHLHVSLVNKGDFVRIGDVIGTVGHTGEVTGDHLHLELEDAAGVRFDPYDCYIQSQRLSPYGITPTQGDDENKKPLWPWLVGGGVLALTTVIIIAATRDKE